LAALHEQEIAMALLDYLDDLIDPTKALSTAKLVNLSDLSNDEMSDLRERWEDTRLDRRQAIIERLAELIEDNVELNFDKVFLFALDDENAEIRVRAMRGLWEYEGLEFIRRLVRMLREDPDPGVRAEAAFALGRFEVLAELDALPQVEVTEIDQALRGVISDPAESVEVRARAIEAVGARSEPWVGPIIQSAYDGQNHRLKISALEAMGRTCNSDWLPLLYGELENEDPEIRFEAAGALGEIGDEESVPHLLNRLEDEDTEVQDTVIAALGAIGGRRSRGALERLVKHPEERIRDAAQAALEQIDFDDDPLSLKIKR
jgi:HEAT repeat protein